MMRYSTLACGPVLGGNYTISPCLRCFLPCYFVAVLGLLVELPNGFSFYPRFSCITEKDTNISSHSGSYQSAGKTANCAANSGTSACGTDEGEQPFRIRWIYVFSKSVLMKLAQTASFCYIGCCYTTDPERCAACAWPNHT